MSVFWSVCLSAVNVSFLMLLDSSTHVSYTIKCCLHWVCISAYLYFFSPIHPYLHGPRARSRIQYYICPYVLLLELLVSFPLFLPYRRRRIESNPSRNCIHFIPVILIFFFHCFALAFFSTVPSFELLLT